MKKTSDKVYIVASLAIATVFTVSYFSYATNRPNINISRTNAAAVLLAQVPPQVTPVSGSRNSGYTVSQGLLVKCTGKPLANTGENECTFVDLMSEIRYLMDFAFVMALPITVIALTAAGIKLLLAQDDTGKRKQAKDIMVKVLVGFIFILAAWLIVYTITHVLGSTTFNLTRFLQP